MESTEGVVLVGHGGLAADTPRELVKELRRLQRERKDSASAHPSEREVELEDQVRNWPRNSDNDPYKAGLESIATELRSLLGERKLIAAYNEFCAPTVEQAIDELAGDGVTNILVVTTMLTPGGSHSERDVPELIDKARRRHPAIRISYAWPFEPARIARFLAEHLDGP